MKFRCKLFDAGSISQFHAILNTTAKFCKRCCLKLTPDKLYFVHNEGVLSGGISLWIDVNQRGIFDDYRIEGKDDTGCILMSISVDDFAKSIANASSATYVKIKLTNKHSACLSLEIAFPTDSSMQRIITHDIPVNLVPLTHWGLYEEPSMPHFDVSVYLPHLKLLKKVVESFKNISNKITLNATSKGDMTLSIDTDLVSIKTLFTDLEIPRLIDHEMETTRNMGEVSVNIKKLLVFIQGHSIGASKAIANIVHQQALQLFLIQDDVKLQYYLPAIDSI